MVVVGLDVKTSLFRVSSDCDPVQDLTFGPTSAILNSAEMLQDHLPADVSMQTMQTVQTVQSEPAIQSAKWSIGQSELKSFSLHARVVLCNFLLH